MRIPGEMQVEKGKGRVADTSMPGISKGSWSGVFLGKAVRRVSRLVAPVSLYVSLPACSVCLDLCMCAWCMGGVCVVCVCACVVCVCLRRNL